MRSLTLKGSTKGCGVRQILLDTNAYAAFKRGEEEAVEILRHAQAIGLSSIVLGELLSGFACARKEAENRRELNAFLKSPRVTIIPVDRDTSEFYSRAYLALRRKGKPIPADDLWIAASALQHGMAVSATTDILAKCLV
jgi:tRNA(fMet)-specific endonuclease VapC